MWDLPRPGLEPVSPALAGRLSTTTPPGKPPDIIGYISPLQNPPSTFHLIILAFTNGSCLNTLFHEGWQNVDFPILSSFVHLLISSICLL